jgi:hypothetical protein
MKSILSTSILAVLATPMFFAADKATATAGEGGAASGEAPKLEEPPNPIEFLRDHPITESEVIELKKLVVDAGTQPRVAIADEMVKEYAEVIKTAIKEEQPNPFESLPDDKLPQVFRDGTGRCVLADGFHRYGAHKAAHLKEMKVAIRNGTERDALLFSLSTNKEHGVQRTNKDKARAIKIVLNDPVWHQMPNTVIARFCGTSEFMVRELRSVAKTPTVRQVTIRGKKTTMNTAAIGKGKGGGAKGAKAAKKSKNKGAVGAGAAGATAGTADKAAAAAAAAQEIDKLLIKIADAIGGEKGGAVRKAVHDGSLELTPRDIRDWAGFGAKEIRNIADLITGGARMKPAKAFDFVKSELSEKIVTELHNRAIGSGGKFEYEGDGIKIVATHVVKK